MLSDRCLSVLSCPVSNVGTLRRNGWTDQDETWHAGSLGPGRIVLYVAPAPLPKKGAKPPIFGPCLSWRNGCMD